MTSDLSASKNYILPSKRRSSTPKESPILCTQQRFFLVLFAPTAQAVEFPHGAAVCRVCSSQHVYQRLHSRGGRESGGYTGPGSHVGHRGGGDGPGQPAQPGVPGRYPSADPVPDIGGRTSGSR